MSGLRAWKMQLGGHFKWNAAVKSQFTFWGQGCSKTISLHLGSSTWNSPLKTDNPLLLCQSFKVNVCVSLCVCVCVRVNFEMRGIKGGGWLSSAPYLSPSNQQHSGQNVLSQRRHRVKSVLSWKGIKSVPIVTFTIQKEATPEDYRLQENKEKKKNKN